ncbi:cyclic nucleotide-gated channel 12 [Striga asiatica]|uniref:Cyclic nucleotide-gated channel 12 n=1 Tax=Striga asiatica TaxID=4170 RepID=A0A5A7PY52_STRAF|nr:cyclic nucleotide-gated channel 12 [Striga asiatica]
MSSSSIHLSNELRIDCELTIDSLLLPASSSSSIVSHNTLPLVSGNQITNNPHAKIVTPNTPYDKNHFPPLAAAATTNGPRNPPSKIASLTTDTAEFLTHVGKSSSTYTKSTSKAIFAPKNESNSNPIFNHPLDPTKTTPTTLQTPLSTHNPIINAFLLILPITGSRAADERSPKTAFIPTLKYRFSGKLPRPNGIP